MEHLAEQYLNRLQQLVQSSLRMHEESVLHEHFASVGICAYEQGQG